MISSLMRYFRYDVVHCFLAIVSQSPPIRNKLANRAVISLLEQNVKPACSALPAEHRPLYTPFTQ
ncbi:MAG: hypothetical protein CL587_12640 [Alteromonadaceae bacterium]|nr:hypothetical protein [Alteromonadaceae bacterium]